MRAFSSAHSTQRTIASQFSDEHLLVAVGLVQFPRHGDDRVAPAGGAGHHRELVVEVVLDATPVRREVRDAAVVELVVAHRPQPLPAEPEHVVEPRRRRREDLVVAGPCQALPGRAVGRHVHGVAAEAPVGDLVEPVEVVVAAGEGAGAAQVGVHDLHRDARGIQRSAVAREARVLESVNGVARLEDLAVRSGDDLIALHEDHRRLARPLGVEMGGGEVSVEADVLAVVDRGGACPRGRGRVRRIQPDAFWPKSTTHTPGSISRIDRGARDSTTRTGGAGDQSISGASTASDDARGRGCPPPR